MPQSRYLHQLSSATSPLHMITKFLHNHNELGEMINLKIDTMWLQKYYKLEKSTQGSSGRRSRWPWFWFRLILMLLLYWLYVLLHWICNVQWDENQDLAQSPKWNQQLDLAEINLTNLYSRKTPLNCIIDIYKMFSWKISQHMQCGENSPQFLQNAETDHKKGYPDAQKGDFRASQKNPDWIHVNTDFLL